MSELKLKRTYKGKQIRRTAACRKNLPTTKARANPSSPAPGTSQPSTSRRKIEYFVNTDEYEEVSDCNDQFLIIDQRCITELFALVACNYCGQKQLAVNISENLGFVRKLTLTCDACKEEYGASYTSPRNNYSTTNTSGRASFLLNTRMVDAFVSLGKGYNALEQFGMEVGMPVLSKTSFLDHLRETYASSDKFCEKFLEKAREAVRNVHGATKDQVLDLSVSYDGTWDN